MFWREAQSQGDWRVDCQAVVGEVHGGRIDKQNCQMRLRLRFLELNGLIVTNEGNVTWLAALHTL